MFKQQIFSFSENLENLRDFVDTVSAFLSEKQEEDLKKNAINFAPFVLAMHQLDPDEFKLDNQTILKIEREFGSKIETIVIEEKDGEISKKGVSFKLESDAHKKFISAMKSYKANEHHRREALYGNALISLISSVEWFLSQLIHKHYKENPGMIGTTEKQFSLGDLSNFESVEDARIFLIDKTVESVLRGSIDDWIDFFKSKLKLSMSYVDEHRKHLVEACLRRNLLVHNGGIVNRVYLANYPEGLGGSPKIGDKLDVSQIYLTETISLFERCFLLMAAELWKKVEPDNEERGDLLIDLGFSHLKAERYDISESLSYFTDKDKSLQEATRLCAKVNYWISKKYGGDFESVKTEIQKTDFSAKSKLFRLAQNTLLDNFENVKRDITYLIEHDENFSFQTVQDWPLFKGFRETYIYQELLEEYNSTQ